MRSEPTDHTDPGKGASDVCVSDGINVNAIIIRMKKEYEVTSDADLAKVMGTAKTTISSWRRRNSIPLDFIVKAAVDCISSIDYIVFGFNSNEMSPGIHEIDIDVRLMELSMYVIDNYDVGSTILSDFDKSAFRARYLLYYYKRSREMLSDLVDRGVSSREEALISLKNTFDALKPIDDGSVALKPTGDDSKARGD